MKLNPFKIVGLVFFWLLMASSLSRSCQDLKLEKVAGEAEKATETAEALLNEIDSEITSLSNSVELFELTASDRQKESQQFLDLIRENQIGLIRLRLKYLRQNDLELLKGFSENIDKGSEYGITYQDIGSTEEEVAYWIALEEEQR